MVIGYDSLWTRNRHTCAGQFGLWWFYAWTSMSSPGHVDPQYSSQEKGIRFVVWVFNIAPIPLSFRVASLVLGIHFAPVPMIHPWRIWVYKSYRTPRTCSNNKVLAANGSGSNFVLWWLTSSPWRLTRKTRGTFLSINLMHDWPLVLHCHWGPLFCE